MSTRARRAVAVAVSALAGVIGGVVTNVATERPTWPWVVGLATVAVVLVASQVYVSLSDGGERGVRTTAAGSVAAGRTVDGDVEIVTSGPARRPAAAPPADGGVAAHGPGSVAAGRDVKGRIRIRSTER